MTRRVSVSECPNCGAPVDPSAIGDPDNPACPFCHAVLPLEPAPVAPPPPPYAPFQQPFTPAPPTFATPYSRRRRGGVGVALLIVLLAVGAGVGIPIALLIKHGSGLGRTYLITGAPVPAGTGQVRDVFVTAYDSGSNGPLKLELVDPVKGSVVWSTDGLGENGGSGDDPVIVPAGSEVLTVAATTVDAFNAKTGKRLWHASISNSLDGSCTGRCAAVVGGHLVTLAKDGTLQSFRVATGAQSWRHRFSDTPRWLEPVGSSVGVVTSSGAPSGGNLLALYDPATGRTRTVIPSCGSSNGNQAVAGDPSEFFVSPDGRSLTVLLAESGGCVARYSLSSGQRLWRSPPDENNKVVPFDLTNESAFATSSVLAWTNSVGSNRWLFTADLRTGAIRRLSNVGSGGGSVRIDGVVGTTLVLESAPSYETSKPAVIGFNLDTGRKLWKIASLVASDGDTQQVFVDSHHVLADTCAGQSYSCHFEVINPNLGTIGGSSRVAGDLVPDFGLATEASGSLLASPESNLVVINMATAAVEATWHN